MKNIILVIFLMTLSVSAKAVAYAPPSFREVFIASTTTAASFNSSTFTLRSSKYSIYTKWTETVAALAGSIKLQSSNDNINWVDVGGSTVAIAGSGDSLYNVANASYLYVRAVITLTGGTGTFEGTMVKKQH